MAVSAYAQMTKSLLQAAEDLLISCRSSCLQRAMLSTRATRLAAIL